MSEKAIIKIFEMTKKGIFVLFEGCDGCGKSTQAKILHDSGFLGESIQMEFPSRSTPIGQMIDGYLKNTSDLNDQVIHLLFSANRWELVSKIKETLDSGVSIICDRYWYSGVAYSVAKGLPLDWCKCPDQGLPKPDIVIVPDIDPKLLQNRKGFGEERYEKLQFQTKVREVFDLLKEDNWVFLDGTLPIEQLTDKVKEVIQPLLGK